MIVCPESRHPGVPHPVNSGHPITRLGRPHHMIPRSRARRTSLWLFCLVCPNHQQCFLDSCVPYTVPRRGHILYSRSPLVVAFSIRQSHPKSSLLPAPPQNLPLASRQVRPTATLNNNNRRHPRPMMPQEPPQRPHRAQGHLHQPSQRRPQPPLRWHPTRR